MPRTTKHRQPNRSLPYKLVIHVGVEEGERYRALLARQASNPTADLRAYLRRVVAEGDAVPAGQRTPVQVAVAGKG